MDTIAVIGLGEVGGYYAGGLAQGGANVKAFDIMMLQDPQNEKFLRFEKEGIRLAWSMEELLNGSDLVLAVTTASAAVQTALSAKPHLRQGQIYVEFNSAVPAVKEQIQEILCGIDVVDGTTMASAKQLRHKTPVNISGEKGKEVSDILNRYGMCTEYIGEKVGQASALKVIRSIFMKGFEAALVESMYTAEVYGVAGKNMESILSFFRTKSMEELLNMFITTDVIHARRRAEEMEAICHMLQEADLECTMSEASMKKLNWVGKLGMEKEWTNQPPEHWEDALKVMVRYSKKLDKGGAMS